VMATYGETVVLATVVAAKTPREGVDFLPLTVDYQEKTYAAGRIPGGYFKREGRPTEKETLVSRLIDRPIRPLFPEGFRNEIQVIATVLSFDNENDPDIVALIGCSAALTLSGIPFFGPVAAARVGYRDGQYILNTTEDDKKTSQLDLVVAGTADGVLMVESEAQELPEEIMLGAVTFGHQSFQPVIAAIIELAERAAKDPWQLTEKSDATTRGMVRHGDLKPGPRVGQQGVEARSSLELEVARVAPYGRAGHGRCQCPAFDPGLQHQQHADRLRGERPVLGGERIDELERARARQHRGKRAVGGEHRRADVDRERLEAVGLARIGDDGLAVDRHDEHVLHE